MKKIIGLLFVSILLLAGCGSSTSNNPCDIENKEIAMVTDEGGINDKSFNQGTWEGIQEYCEEYKVGASYVETKDVAQIGTNLSAAAEKAKVVVASGFKFEKSIAEVAQKNPDVKFILIDGIPKNENDETVVLDNVKSYLFKEAEAGYLVGYIAGKITETNKLGFMGGLEIPPVQKFGWGYLQGIEASNPDAVVEYNYTQTFSDASKGKAVADTMFSSGVDILFTAAGGTNVGAINVARNLSENGDTKWIIGVDSDMYLDGLYKAANEEKSVILTSAIKKVGVAAFDGIKLALDDMFNNTTETRSYLDQGVGIPAENPNLDSEAYQAIINEAIESLKTKTVIDTKDALNINVKVNGQY